MHAVDLLYLRIFELEEVEILDKVMEATNASHDVSLCTASWGGIVALAFAARRPHAVKRLLLGSIGTRPNRTMVEVIQKGCALDLNDREQFSSLLIDSFGQKLPESIKKKITAQFRTINRETLRSFCEHGLKVISVEKLSDDRAGEQRMAFIRAMPCTNA